VITCGTIINVDANVATGTLVHGIVFPCQIVCIGWWSSLIVEQVGNPSTLAGDAKLLLSFGYHKSSIQVFNLFPQTWHIKRLTIFERMDDGEVKIMVE
jgi:hypothetical protein